MKRIIRLLFPLLVLPAVAQVAVTPIVQPRVTFVNNSGGPCATCKLYSYAAGTTTPLATYTDASGISQNTNPIILDAAGGANIWLGANSYKLILKDPDGTTIWSVDQVNSGSLLPCSSANAIQTANSAVNGLNCDPTITINTATHTINIGTLGANHVTIGALGTATSWTFDTTSPATALASLGAGIIAPGTANQLAIYPSDGNSIQGTSVIPSAITATTQAINDKSQKLATTNYVSAPGNINPTSISVNGGTNITGNQGSGVLLQHSTGSFTVDNCTKYDATGNTVDAGKPCNAPMGGIQLDVTASRTFGSTYQNPSNYLMMVQGYLVTTAGGADGMVACSNGPTSGLGNTPFSESPTATDANGQAEFHISVPAGWYYECDASGTMNPILSKWYETTLQ